MNQNSGSRWSDTDIFPDGTRTLSSVLSSFPASFTGTQIHGANKAISEIDILPKKFHGAVTVYLSNNLITTLRNITQFTNISTLSLSNNQITDFHDCEPLQQCPTLRTLSLQNNPITQRPFYRLRILQLCPSLDILDNMEVDTKELQESLLINEKEQTYLKLLLQNDLLLRHLEQIAMKQVIHDDLNQLFRNIQQKSPLNLNVLFQLFNPSVSVEITESEQEMMLILGHLEGEVIKAWRVRWFRGQADAPQFSRSLPTGSSRRSLTSQNALTEGESWDLAYSDVTISQQNLIVAYLSMLESRNNSNDVNRHRDKTETSQFSALSSLIEDLMKQSIFECSEHIVSYQKAISQIQQQISVTSNQSNSKHEQIARIPKQQPQKITIPSKEHVDTSRSRQSVRSNDSSATLPPKPPVSTIREPPKKKSSRIPLRRTGNSKRSQSKSRNDSDTASIDSQSSAISSSDQSSTQKSQSRYVALLKQKSRERRSDGKKEEKPKKILDDSQSERSHQSLASDVRSNLSDTSRTSLSHHSHQTQHSQEIGGVVMKMDGMWIEMPRKGDDPILDRSFDSAQSPQSPSQHFKPGRSFTDPEVFPQAQQNGQWTDSAKSLHSFETKTKDSLRRYEDPDAHPVQTRDSFERQKTTDEIVDKLRKEKVRLEGELRKAALMIKKLQREAATRTEEIAPEDRENKFRKELELEQAQLFQRIRLEKENKQKNRDTAVEFALMWFKRRWIRMFRMASIAQKLKRKREARLNHILLKECWSGWNDVRKKKEQERTEGMEGESEIKHFGIRLVESRRLLESEEQMALEQEKLLSSRGNKDNRTDKATLRHLLAAHERWHNQMTKQRVIRGWLDLLAADKIAKEEAKDQSRKQEAVSMFIKHQEEKSLRTILREWRDVATTQHQTRKAGELCNRWVMDRRQRTIFEGWRRKKEQRRTIRKELVREKAMRIKKLRFEKWKEVVKEAKQDKLNEHRATQFRDRILMRRGFAGFLTNHEQSQNEKIAERRAASFNSVRLLRVSFLKLKLHTKSKQTIHLKMNVASATVLDKGILRRVWREWKLHVASKRAMGNTLNLLVRQRKRDLERRVFFGWWRTAGADEEERRREITANLVSLEHATTNLVIENLQEKNHRTLYGSNGHDTLLSQLHELTAENATLRIDLSESAAALRKWETAQRDLEGVIADLRRRLTEKSEECAKSAVEVERFRRELARTASSFGAERAEWDITRSKLGQEVKNARTNYSERANQDRLRSEEEKARQRQNDERVIEAENRLGEAHQMLGEARDLLNVKDSRIMSLQQELDKTREQAREERCESRKEISTLTHRIKLLEEREKSRRGQLEENTRTRQDMRTSNTHHSFSVHQNKLLHQSPISTPG